MRTNTPDMNITNQINAGMNDVRASLITLSEAPRFGTDQADAIMKATFQLNAIVDMIMEHNEGRSQPWSDRKYVVEEEFS